MQRRKFLTTLSLSAMASFLPLSKVFSSDEKLQSRNFIIKPGKLNEGDTLGLIAPGSFISKEELEESIANLEGLGFKVKFNKSILDRNGYLAGTDSVRANDINTMFADKEVNGIICARGGYGCNRLLPFIDYDNIKNNPKVLCGYSDITSLISAIFTKTGLVSFHGPVGISTFNDFSVQYFKDVLMKSEPNVVLRSADEENENSDYDRYTIRSGVAEGILVGGNLSIITSLLGTPYDMNYDNKIIYLEEVGEEPYRVDRMLTELILAGKFKHAAGIAIGVFKNCEPRRKNASFSNSFSLKEVLFDRLFDLGIPVVYGLSFGHIANKFTLPTGVNAKLDVAEQTLTLLEQSVT
jgi:muramoyltetrapeptide carboxypeptidase